MARSYLLEESRLQSEIDKTAAEIRLAIVTAEERKRISRAQTIKHSGMSNGSFYNAWSRPELFRVGQLIKIYDFLKVPQEERRFT